MWPWSSGKRFYRHFIFTVPSASIDPRNVTTYAKTVGEYLHIYTLSRAKWMHWKIDNPKRRESKYTCARGQTITEFVEKKTKSRYERSSAGQKLKRLLFHTFFVISFATLIVINQTHHRNKQHTITAYTFRPTKHGKSEKKMNQLQTMWGEYLGYSVQTWRTNLTSVTSSNLAAQPESKTTRIRRQTKKRKNAGKVRTQVIARQGRRTGRQHISQFGAGRVNVCLV